MSQKFWQGQSTCEKLHLIYSLIDMQNLVTDFHTVRAHRRAFAGAQHKIGSFAPYLLPQLQIRVGALVFGVYWMLDVFLVSGCGVSVIY